MLVPIDRGALNRGARQLKDVEVIGFEFVVQDLHINSYPPCRPMDNVYMVRVRFFYKKPMFLVCSS